MNRFLLGFFLFAGPILLCSRNTEESSKANSIYKTENEIIESILPHGTYTNAEFFGGLMTHLGTGTVFIGVKKNQDRFVSLRKTATEAYSFTISNDLSICSLDDGTTIPSKGGFSKKDGGALGPRLDRSWETDRYTIMIGRISKDGTSVVYFRDRLTNDPLLIVKFVPQPK